MQTSSRNWTRGAILIVFILVLTIAIAPKRVLAGGPHVYPDYGNYLTTGCLFADGFQSYEEIALWIERPDGGTEAAFPAANSRANINGELGPQDAYLDTGFACFFSSTEWKNGEYKIVARGLKSGHEAVGRFTYVGQFPTSDKAGLFMSEQHYNPSETPWYTYTGYGFTPFSTVETWLGTPDGGIQIPEEHYLFADGQGTVRGTILRRELLNAEGEYMIAASEGKHEYSTKFLFLLNDANKFTIPTDGFVFSPSAGPYQTWFNGVGVGFEPYEIVAVWLELPSGVIFDERRTADDKGRVFESWQSFVGEPVGAYHFVARGEKSHHQVDGTFTVLDTLPDP